MPSNISLADLQQSLLLAIQSNKLEIVEIILKNVKDVERFTYSDNDGNTFLHHAALKNNPTMIKLLLQYKADITQQNKAEETPIVVASSKGYWDCVEAFAENRWDVNGQGKYGSALLDAAMKDQFSTVLKLLKAGAKTSWHTVSDENTPLHYAVLNKNPHMVALLLSYKANNSKKNKNGLTPLGLANENNLWGCIQIFTSTKEINRLRREPGERKWSLFNLIRATKQVDNVFSKIPLDLVKLILRQVPGWEEIDVDKIDKEITLNAAKALCKEQSKLKIILKNALMPSNKNNQFIAKLDDIVNSSSPVNKRFSQTQEAIGKFLNSIPNDSSKHMVVLLSRYHLCSQPSANKATNLTTSIEDDWVNVTNEGDDNSLMKIVNK